MRTVLEQPHVIDNFLKNKISLDAGENVLLPLKEMDKNGYENRDIFYYAVIGLMLNRQKPYT
jgi:hypothetical protein